MQVSSGFSFLVYTVNVGLQLNVLHVQCTALGDRYLYELIYANTRSILADPAALNWSLESSKCPLKHLKHFDIYFNNGLSNRGLTRAGWVQLSRWWQPWHLLHITLFKQWEHHLLICSNKFYGVLDSFTIWLIYLWKLRSSSTCLKFGKHSRARQSDIIKCTEVALIWFSLDNFVILLLIKTIAYFKYSEQSPDITKYGISREKYLIWLAFRWSIHIGRSFISLLEPWSLSPVTRELANFFFKSVISVRPAKKYNGVNGVLTNTS